MSNSIPQALQSVQEVQLETDILVIGGGNAGCFAAIEAKKINPDLKVTIMEKANIDRSGCLAGGMDAINTYIPEGKTPEDLVRWSRSQAGGILREDLALEISKNLNEPIEEWERWGLPIKKNEDGSYKFRGQWDIAIQGSEMKPILAEKTREMGVEIINRVVATGYLYDGEKVVGAMGFGVRDGKFYVVKAKATIMAAGGAGGIYKPYTNDGNDCHHQIWYCPFDVGSGYALGIRKGAEMTTFEMRWSAVRTKDFNGPIDTISVCYKTPMINAKGEKILAERYKEFGGDKAPRYIRASAPMEEILAGRGPIYVDTRQMTPAQIKELKTDYLNERPSFVLFLAANGQDISKEPIEVYGSDPYIVGGHTASGYWVDTDWQTTVPGLFACGDVAGGVPNKFVGGCCAEGMLSARGAIKYIAGIDSIDADLSAQIETEKARVFAPLFSDSDGVLPHWMEEKMQRIMDEYAGGVHQFYRLNEERLDNALRHIRMMREQVKYLYAKDLHELMLAHEVIDRLDVAEVLIHHLKFRRETRWPGWQTRMDYPEIDPTLDCFVNSRVNPETGEVEVFTRPYEQILPGDRMKPTL
ncbi:MAG: adenylyl-sulfate reductase subunit alpha [Desulfitobacterium hafniense]|nr:adenylyl-sulfate reductase subunit alpha [Desulfitobacterium hafniense]